MHWHSKALASEVAEADLRTRCSPIDDDDDSLSAYPGSMFSRPLASSSRLIASTSRTPACTACAGQQGAARAFSGSAARRADSSLAGPLPHFAHPNALTSQPLPLSAKSASKPSALTLLRSQPSHYIVALFMGRRYILAPGDVLTVPNLKNTKVGDRLALTRILEVGSRDYTLRAGQDRAHPAATAAIATSAQLAANKVPITLRPPMTRVINVDGVPRDWQRHPDSLPYLSQDVVQADMTVIEHTKGKQFTVEKFKKRKGYHRTLRFKLGFTRLRIGDIKLGKA
ncbi:mitochondrial large subunit ribosomal protein L49 [Rhodotorula toruloides]|uniref:Large ribosomal subunit protein bL21m n=1 Tax=Rhodotorula toruloides TaxID=5286 RepID=A0A511KD52_RHOTO|nr:mitochondrial large subunit ribosomal protein L49 [Rhodotorula toruloides]